MNWLTFPQETRKLHVLDSAVPSLAESSLRRPDSFVQASRRGYADVISKFSCFSRCPVSIGMKAPLLNLLLFWHSSCHHRCLNSKKKIKKIHNFLILPVPTAIFIFCGYNTLLLCKLFYASLFFVFVLVHTSLILKAYLIVIFRDCANLRVPGFFIEHPILFEMCIICTVTTRV